jgi:hypothetical protein
MNKIEKAEWLKAIDELRKHYRQFLPNEIPPSYRRSTRKLCPLCQVGKKTNRSAVACGVCLWLKFEGGACGQNDWSRDLTQQRLSRLNRWEKKIRGIK